MSVDAYFDKPVPPKRSPAEAAELLARGSSGV
jgi:hypothetical protein